MERIDEVKPDGPALLDGRRFYKFVEEAKKRRTNDTRSPTAADIRLAFEIINYRYVNQKVTVLSSEWTMEAMADFDEATASRIAERCGEYQIVVGRDRRKNQRFSMNDA